MATPRADNAAHRSFWAGAEEVEARITIVAEMAADIRANAAPEPDATDAEYDSKARGCELLVAEMIGSRGLIKSATAAGGAKVDYDTREEALSLAFSLMGKYAATPEEPVSSDGSYSGWMSF